MLLLHQTGSVKIGEVIRYTVTYTPAVDRILPSPTHLHLKIKNTSAIALRAAFVHGPYTLYAAAYPSTYNPNEKFPSPRRDGIPEFEPNLKAGGSFYSQLSVPEDVRLSAGTARRSLNLELHQAETPVKSVSWIIEVASQVIFSNSAAVHYEIMLGRDEKSLSFGFSSGTGGSSSTPGHVSDHQQSQGAKDGHHNAQPRGIFTRAIHLTVDDTASLWNTPKFPGWDDVGKERSKENNADAPVEKAAEPPDGAGKDAAVHQNERPKKVHLVLITHGLHSNLGADMLYLKESIDAAARQAREDGRARRAKAREERKASIAQNCRVLAEGDSSSDGLKNDHGTVEDVDEDDEEVIVRGFSGNATRTERGIKYLGKRLAKYVLAMTYPDQPYLPATKSAQSIFSRAVLGEPPKDQHSGQPTHSHSTIIKEPSNERQTAYKITSISFIAHSLGGLIQTYAVAYIQKHSPGFFNLIKPINFIALATPFLGLSNENPLYVKFALDFGLVGRTGQDLGLTWRAPTLARSGWGAIVGSLGECAHKRIDGARNPDTKPILRVLPTGPAHTALKKFRNRTVYSNVVNDGIVPLRTSCLLFLDWQGLGRVEKARRENGFVGTMAGWGWSEFTGANSSTPNRSKSSWAGDAPSDNDSGADTTVGQGYDVPDARESANVDDDSRSIRPTTSHVPSPPITDSPPPTDDDETLQTSTTSNNGNPFSSLFGLFKPASSSTSQNQTPKSNRIYKRSQTLNFGDGASDTNDRPKATRGDSTFGEDKNMGAPPKTSFFEAAGDILAPPLPTVEFLIDPSKRPRAIFHDRVYHPEDIPQPPLKRRQTTWHSRPDSSSNKFQSTPSLSLAFGSRQKPPKHQESSLSIRNDDDTSHTNPDKDPSDVVDGSAMKVEEKIARAYHRDLSWRKVLVRLEPDAHNNIIVRRMFANADGWPVVKHLVDTHFSDQAIAKTRDSDVGSHGRAKGANENPSSEGGETKASSKSVMQDGGRSSPVAEDARGPRASVEPRLDLHRRTDSEIREAKDTVPPLESIANPENTASRPVVQRKESSTWSENGFFDDSGDDSDEGSSSPSLEQEKSPKTKSTAFSWTEAIAGKGRSRSNSPNPNHLQYDGTEDTNQKEGGKSRSGEGQKPEANQPADSAHSLPANDAAMARTFDDGGTRNVGIESIGLPQVWGIGDTESLSHKIAQSLNLVDAGSKEQVKEV